MTTITNYDQAYFRAHEEGLQDPGIYYGIATALAKVYGGCESVLEVGCGRGYITKHLAALYRTVVGLDISEYAIKNPEQSDLVLVRGDIAEFSAKDVVGAGIPKTYDLVFSWQTLEHLESEQAVAKAVMNLDRLSSWHQVHSIYLAPPESEDHPNPAHTMLRARSWWLEVFAASGWFVDAPMTLFFSRVGRWNPKEIFCLSRR